mgnify:CR=1 FL=1
MNTILKSTIIIASLSLPAFLSPDVVAKSVNDDNASTQHDKVGNKHDGKMKLQKLSKQLNLTENQLTQIKAIKNEERAKLDTLKPKMKLFREQAALLMQEDTFDEQAFVVLHAANQETFTRVAVIKANTKFSMNNILSEEQREKYKKMTHKRSKR